MNSKSEVGGETNALATDSSLSSNRSRLGMHQKLTGEV